MRTTVNRLRLPDHRSGWWVGHSLVAIAAALLLIYAAAVLLVAASRWLI
jgi:hypothetical protein